MLIVVGFPFCYSIDESVSVFVSLTMIPRKLLKFIIIKFGMVTASDMRMHHIFSILTVTLTQT